MKNVIFAFVMRLLKKYSCMKCMIICLLCFAVHKADGWFLQDNPLQKQDNPIADVVPDVVSESSFSAPEQKCRIPRQARLANISQANRSYSANGSRNYNAFIKCDKAAIHFFVVICQLSLERFPSGLSGNHHRLISLGKLII